ncbi:MAG: nuclease-related domain-containing protein [Terrimesophilobacter sp.]
MRARTYGHPGGSARERFLGLMREWSGRGAGLDDPYDAELVRSAPREIRQLLAGALAEEATVRAISGLGIGYTVWSDVATDRGKLDHIVLGPAGLFAVMSEDWGSPVRLVRGELIGEGIPPGDQPLRDLVRRSRWMGRTARVRFTAFLIVVPDDSLSEPITTIGKRRDAAVVRFSVLPSVLRDGLGGDQRLSIEDVFDVRTRLQQTIRFV